MSIQDLKILVLISSYQDKYQLGIWASLTRDDKQKLNYSLICLSLMKMPEVPSFSA